MSYNKYARPGLSKLMRLLRIDKFYYKGIADYLYYKPAGGEEDVQVVDFVGGYGSLLLGHNHPAMKAYIHELLDSGLPVHTQLSEKYHTGLLCEKISELVNPDEKYITTLTNSGAESVEAAIKHIRLKKRKALNKITDDITIRFNYVSSLWESRYSMILNHKGTVYKSFDDFKHAVMQENDGKISRLVPCVLSVKGAFHGKTMGALKVTYNNDFKDLFLFDAEKYDAGFFDGDITEVQQMLDANVITLYIPRVSYDGNVVTEEVLFNACLGVIVEPILGEGGVREISPDFLRAVQCACAERKIPLIVDEIQTGMFRTGHFLYSRSIGVNADYYLLGKSMGGGFAKIGAVVINGKEYDEDFGLLHSSTFAEDEFTSAVALRGMALMATLAGSIMEKGAFIKEELKKLQAAFPGVLDSVSGVGLMIGVKFRNFDNSACYPLQFLSRSRRFNYLVSGYLLNTHHIRVGATLSESFTLRIQPSAYISNDDIGRLLKGLTSVCEILANEDIYHLINFLLPEKYRNLRPIQKFENGSIAVQDTGAVNRVAFLAHYIDTENVYKSDYSLSVLPKHVIEDFLEDVVDIKSYILTGSQIIESPTGDKVEILFAALPFTSTMARTALKNGSLPAYSEICHLAIKQLRKKHNVSLVGLGQYTSILTRNGTSIPEKNICLTTGNSFTVYIGIQSIIEKIKQRKEEGLMRECVIGILGAAGNISSVYAKMSASFASRIFLKGSDTTAGLARVERSARELTKYIIQLLLRATHPGALSPLECVIKESRFYNQVEQGLINIDTANPFLALEDELQEHNPIKIFSDLTTLKQCNIVFVATNDPHPFIGVEHLSPNTLVYDVSVPMNVKEELIDNDQNIEVFFGGIVKLPDNSKLPLKGFPLEDGTAYACISETILLGLEQSWVNFSYGNITVDQVRKIGDIGKKHQFEFCDVKRVNIS
ncbi:aminotransferase class III-fold pyridoxal phosphate-dependent enzyme [Chitinophaga sp. 22321]|uniref:Aminotransferase class III-fold pyridoxal phosphate-dependent enzyme n=1 Tax=Chitinophaga hostae TaxID=2831022 RepID=A0ABS5J987_9BACT|nr:aminotransferase class III-fold pyridoxal phosphate-dependent enzyme [Chitinophaga hostae]MBS0031774.1 aminotransferase class III-fold pyridoxal phosphate-dependent enzyme [Chitinophaga hostae]